MAAPDVTLLEELPDAGTDVPLAACAYEKPLGLKFPTAIARGDSTVSLAMRKVCFGSRGSLNLTVFAHLGNPPVSPVAREPLEKAKQGFAPSVACHPLPLKPFLNPVARVPDRASTSSGFDTKRDRRRWVVFRAATGECTASWPRYGCRRVGAVIVGRSAVVAGLSGVKKGPKR